MAIQQHHIEHYRAHGYAVVENFLKEAELDAIRNELKEIMPGWVEFCDNPKNGKPEGWNQAGLECSYGPSRISKIREDDGGRQRCSL